jgi:pilus assembly protein CpaB
MVDPAQLLGPGRTQVPTGLQEVTVKLPIERVIGGSLKAGDTVGVIISYAENEKLNVPDQTKLAFHQVLVTAVQNSSGAVAQDQTTTTRGTASDGSLTSNASAAQPAGGYLVTLARSAVDVEKIIHAIEFGTMYLSKETESSTQDNAGVMERIRVFQ